MPAPGQRSIAKKAGLKTYSTGKICPYGHSSLRFTSNGSCVQCKSIASNSPENIERLKKWAADNIERSREIKREWYRRHADSENAKAKAERISSPQRRERERLSRLKRADKLKIYYREWLVRNRDVARSHLRNCKAKRKSAEGRHSVKDIRLLFEKQDGNCAYCRCDLMVTGYHVDHKVALARGGTNWPDNLCLACPACNTSKQAKSAEEFLRILNFESRSIAA